MYFHVAKQMGVDLSHGYLFRPVSPGGSVLSQGMSYACVYDRLKHYLGILDIDSGESPHSFRHGCAVVMATLPQVESSNSKMMEHIG